MGNPLPYTIPSPSVDPQTWIRRIQNAQQIPIEDPRWGQAQLDIRDMQQRLHGAIPAAASSREFTNQQELSEAQSMSPGATLAEGVAKGASFGLGDFAARLTGSGNVLDASAKAHPTENLIGEGIGTLATMVGPGAALKLARAGRMARYAEEAAQLQNAIREARLARLTGSGLRAGEEAGAAGESATEAAQLGPSGASPAGAAPQGPVVGPAKAPGLALHDAAGNPIEGTEIPPGQAWEAGTSGLGAPRSPGSNPFGVQGPEGPIGRPASPQDFDYRGTPGPKNQVQKALSFGRESPLSPQSRDLIKTLLGQIASRGGGETPASLAPFALFGSQLGQRRSANVQ